MYILLAVWSCLAAAAQASIWPYHGSAAWAPATGAIIEYGPPAYGWVEPPHRLTLGRPNGPVSPILLRGPDASSNVLIGPSEGPVLVQGPREGPRTVIGPQEGPATIVGPSAGAAQIVGPSVGAATLVGPSAGAATIVGPGGGGKIITSGSGGATIIGPSAGAARIVGPSSGAATIVGPSEGPATIVGPSEGSATIVGPSSAGAHVVGSYGGPAIVTAGAHAHAEAHAHADAHVHTDDCGHPPIVNKVIVEPPPSVYVKEVIPQRPVILQDPHRPIVVHDHRPVIVKEHVVDHRPIVVKEHVHRDETVPCVIPNVQGWSAAAAAEAVARAGSKYGPVHVTQVQGRPVITLSGRPSPVIEPVAAYSRPPAPLAVASAHATASSHADDWAVRKYWYPSQNIIWRKDC